MAIDATGQDNYSDRRASRLADQEADRRARESSDSSSSSGDPETRPTLTVNGKTTEIYRNGGKEYFYAKDENGKLIKDGDGKAVKIETKDLLSAGMTLDDLIKSELTTEKMTNGAVTLSIDKNKDGKPDLIATDKKNLERDPGLLSHILTSFSPSNYIKDHKEGLNMLWDAEIEGPVEHLSATVVTAGAAVLALLSGIPGCNCGCPGNWANKDPDNCSNPGYNTD